MPRDASSGPKPHAIVAGAGFGGIAAALRLRSRGYDVHLIDRCPRLGGRAQVFERDGFRHDAGPTVITAPNLFTELFALFGKRLEDYGSASPRSQRSYFESNGAKRSVRSKAAIARVMAS